MEKYLKLSDAIEELDRLVRTKQIEIIHGDFENIEKHFEDMSKNNPLDLQVSLAASSSGAKSELLPCPFCGEMPNFSKIPSLINGAKMWQIECEGYKCEIAPGTDLYKSKNDCLADWNKRAKP